MVFLDNKDLCFPSPCIVRTSCSQSEMSADMIDLVFTTMRNKNIYSFIRMESKRRLFFLNISRPLIACSHVYMCSLLSSFRPAPKKNGDLNIISIFASYFMENETMMPKGSRTVQLQLSNSYN